MKNGTRELIENFQQTKNITLITSILLAFQEEDSLAETITHKNNFKYLRNLCAHTPATITSQILNVNNRGQSRLTFACERDGETSIYTLDIIQLSVWLFEMYMLTDQIHYIKFWHTLMNILYPDTSSLTKCNQTFLFKPNLYRSTRNLQSDWQDFLYNNFKIVKTMNIMDPYYQSLYESNRKVYMKVAFPDLMYVLKIFAACVVNPCDKENLKGFITIYDEREGLNDEK